MGELFVSYFEFDSFYFKELKTCYCCLCLVMGFYQFTIQIFFHRYCKNCTLQCRSCVDFNGRIETFGRCWLKSSTRHTYPQFRPMPPFLLPSGCHPFTHVPFFYSSSDLSNTVDTNCNCKLCFGLSRGFQSWSLLVRTGS